MSSKALANDFKIEFIYFKKKLVTIPMAALFIMINITSRRQILFQLVALNAWFRFPVTARIRTLHAIESRYMNTFCT